MATQRRESKRGSQADLLKRRVAELEGQLAEKERQVATLKQEANMAMRKALLLADGTLNYLCFCRPKGSKCGVLQVSCTKHGLPRIRTGFSVDGKDFRAVYARAVQLMVETFNVADDVELVRAMHASCDTFLAVKGLQLVSVTYEQVVARDGQGQKAD